VRSIAVAKATLARFGTAGRLAFSPLRLSVSPDAVGGEQPEKRRRQAATTVASTPTSETAETPLASITQRDIA
jgi:hypothetical protein